jgi:hypothetical protein
MCCFDILYQQVSPALAMITDDLQSLFISHTTVMHLTTTVLTLLAAASISSAASSYSEYPEESSPAYAPPISTTSSEPSNTPCSVVQEGDYVWRISDFSSRKPDGTDVSSISFNVSATSSGTLDFQCETSAEDNTFLEEGKLYNCGENSLVCFTFQSDGLSSTRILLKQKASDG